MAGETRVGSSTTTHHQWDKTKISSLTSKKVQNEKCEEAIKRARKMQENKTCLTCSGPGSLAPQYACVNFSIFICTRCAGVYREFGFRVKSVSASTFTPEEVDAFVNGGGNENAKRKYFAKYDELKFPKPESNETSKIKGFVKAALLDKIWMEDEGGGHASTTMGTRDDAIPNAHREKSPDLFGGLFEDETNNNAEQQQQQDQEKDNATVNWSSFASPPSFSPPRNEISFNAAEQTNNPPPETSKTITSLFDTEGQVQTGESEFNQNFALRPPPRVANVVPFQQQQQQQQPSPQQEQQQNDTIGGNVGGRAMLDDDFWTQPVAPAPVVAASAPINMPAMPGMPQMPGLGISAQQQSAPPPPLPPTQQQQQQQQQQADPFAMFGSMTGVSAPPPKQSVVQPVMPAMPAIPAMPAMPAMPTTTQNPFSSPPPPQQQQQEQEQQQADPFAMFGGMTGVSAPPSKQPVAQPVMPAMPAMPTTQNRPPPPQNSAGYNPFA